MPSGSEAPLEMAWFRDWWAGRRFAQSYQRLGQLDIAIADRKARLRQNPSDTATRMMLAYLYEANGELDQASQMWAKLEDRNE